MATLTMPVFALAAEVKHAPGGGTIFFVAGPGEANAVSITIASDPECSSSGLASPCYVISDSAGVTTPPSLPAGNDCVATPPTTTARCPVAGVSTADLDLSDLDDQATITAAIIVLGRAGTGDDTVAGGPVGDELRGHAGSDTLDGGGGDDKLWGKEISDETGDGGNTLRGGEGGDTLEGGDAIDSIDGGPGDDAVFGFAGADTLTGGDGRDLFSGGDGNDTILGQGGNDELGAVDQLGLIAVPRERGNDIFDGGPGDDVLRAGAGAFQGVSDADSLSGGEGRDTVDYAARSASLTVSLDGTGNDGALGEGDNVTTTVEAVASGAGDDRITGTNASETFNGGVGDDVLTGAGGADTLTGSGGDDDLIGGSDADTLDGGDGEDYVEGGEGRDTMRGGGGSDTLATRDEAPDALASCGERIDFAIADQRDKLTECNRFDKNSADRPVLGRKAALRPLEGQLEVRLPGTGRFVPLRDQADVPVGVRVDASGANDEMSVTMAGRGNAAASKRRKRGKASQKAVFSGGAFSVVQRRSRRPVTDIRLVGGSFAVCKATSRGLITPVTSRRDRVRRLWGRAKGRFRTHGRYSATTVRGTTWLTEDRCDGTLTTVRSGTVVVSDLGRRRDVVVRKGGRYLARPR